VKKKRLIGQEAIDAKARFDKKHKKNPEILKEVDDLLARHVNWTACTIAEQLIERLKAVQATAMETDFLTAK